jgi:uncharacterized protein YlxW (UPF0749 family)
MDGAGFFALFLALGFGVCMPLIIGFFSYKEKQRKLQRELAIGASAEMKAELASMREEAVRLRERVAVLERLVTDSDRSLAAELDRLAASARSSSVV